MDLLGARFPDLHSAPPVQTSIFGSAVSAGGANSHSFHPGLHSTMSRSRSPTRTEEDIQVALGLVVQRLTRQNYDQSFAFYRFWFGLAKTHSLTTPDQIFDAIWSSRRTIPLWDDEFDHSVPPLILRFASDAESDGILAPYSVGLCNRICASFLREFFAINMRGCGDAGLTDGDGWLFCANVIFVAHLVDMGHVEEAVVRDHILQSLISHPMGQSKHQVFALVILFEFAGAIFEKYVDPSVVDRCFELFNDPYAQECMGNQLLLQVRVVSRNGRLGPG